MRRRRSPAMEAIGRWGVLAAVVIILAVGIVRYSSRDEARSVIRWDSARQFMEPEGAFEKAGFRIVCDFGDAVPSCTMLWAPPRDPKSKPVQVYECDTDRDVRRDDVLLRFAKKAEPAVTRPVLDHSLAVLNAFFQSGLRREIDRAVRRARSHRQFANRMPPFELRQDQNDPALWCVAGLDAAQQAIPTGLPRRPEYGAPVYARWEQGRKNLIEVRVRSRNAETSIWLNPASNRPCHPVYPGGAPDGDCVSVPVLACASCAEPVMNVRALSDGRALVMRSSDQARALLSRGLKEMSASDMIVSDARSERSTTLYAKSAKAGQDLAVEITHDASPQLSRLQMVNGRWTRWYDPSVKRWLAPVVTRMEQFTTEKRIAKPNEPMRLSLDIGLQRDLDDALEQWMAKHAEAGVIADVVQHDRRRKTTQQPYRGESNHQRPVPEAGVTVLDAATGEILAVASYPPATALRYEEGVPTFAPSWRQRLAGVSISEATTREIASELADRIEEDANSNFVRHPIGSTIKPILLSLVMDADSGRTQRDGLDRFFDLTVAGHANHGGDASPPRCPTCIQPTSEPIAGLPLGPWGSEEAAVGHRLDPWIDRRDFVWSSCNKYAITFGVLAMLDWTKAGPAGQACCWLPARDAFTLPTANGATVTYSDASQLPPTGPWLDASTLAAIPDTANAPIFQRLAYYYGVHAGTTQQVYDSSPWIRCVQIPGLEQTVDANAFVGRVETTQLGLTSSRVTTAFTNLFTGAGRNWWTNVKLAEAYARMATNRAVTASFCGSPETPPAPLFTNRERWNELTGILSQQRMQAGWVRAEAGRVSKWVADDPKRMTLSKTGTSLRDARYNSTGIFAIYLGGTQNALPNGDRIPDGKGLIVIAHVDDIGHSSMAVALVDELLQHIQSRVR